jgi:hypothetical protein
MGEEPVWNSRSKVRDTTRTGGLDTKAGQIFRIPETSS